MPSRRKHGSQATTASRSTTSDMIHGLETSSRRSYTSSRSKSKSESSGQSELRIRVEVDTHKCSLLRSMLVTTQDRIDTHTRDQLFLVNSHTDNMIRHNAAIALLEKEQRQVQLQNEHLSEKLVEARELLDQIKVTVDSKYVQLARYFIPRKFHNSRDCENNDDDAYGWEILGHNPVSQALKDREQLLRDTDVSVTEDNKVAYSSLTNPVAVNTKRVEVRNQLFVRSNQFLTQLITPLPIREYNKSEIICHATKPASEMYFITKGRVNIVQSGIVVATLEEGDFFGEIALLFPTYRTATCVAITNVKCSILISEAFHGKTMTAFPSQLEVIKKLARARLEEYTMTRLLPMHNLLCEYRNGTEFGEEFKRQFARHLMAKHCRSGDILMEQNSQDCSDMYFIVSGEVDVTHNDSYITTISEGVVGESASFFKASRNCTVSAKSNCILIQLSKEGFTKMINIVPSLYNVIVELAKTRKYEIRGIKEFVQHSLWDKSLRRITCDFRKSLLSHCERVEFDTPPRKIIIERDSFIHVVSGCVSYGIRFGGGEKKYFLEPGQSSLDSPGNRIGQIMWNDNKDDCSLIVYTISGNSLSRLSYLFPSEISILRDQYQRTTTTAIIQPTTNTPSDARTLLDQIKHQLTMLEGEDLGIGKPIPAREADRLKDIMMDKSFETSRGVISSNYIPRPPSSSDTYFKKRNLFTHSL